MVSGEEQDLSKINRLNNKLFSPMTFCGVCKIYLNSSLQADAHYAGKSHKNKAKGQGSQDGPATDVLTATPNNVQFHKCDICQKYFNSSLQLRDHTYGKSHQQMALKKLENNANTLNTETINLGTLNPGTMTTGILDTGTGILQDATKNEPVEKITELTNVGRNLSQLFQCEKCNITLNSKKQLDQHYKGLRHRIIIGKANPPEAGGERWENVRFTKISNAILGINKDTAAGSGGGMNIREYHCEKCDITVNSQVQLNQHLESNKHKMKGVQTPPSDGQNKRKRPPPTGTGGGQKLQQGDNKRPYHGPKPLSYSFVHSNTYIPAGGGQPVYRLPPISRQYEPLNMSVQSWTSYNSFGYDTNVAMF